MLPLSNTRNTNGLSGEDYMLATGIDTRRLKSMHRCKTTFMKEWRVKRTDDIGISALRASLTDYETSEITKQPHASFTLRDYLCVRCGSTAEGSRMRTPQWSRRSPVRQTGGLGLCSALSCGARPSAFDGEAGRQGPDSVAYQELRLAQCCTLACTRKGFHPSKNLSRLPWAKLEITYERIRYPAAGALNTWVCRPGLVGTLEPVVKAGSMELGT